jgi:hypothetical protein
MADVLAPIEVEVQPGAATCAPGYEHFDEGFRAALHLAQLATVDAAREHGVIPNSFCLASERPEVHPLRVRVRIRCDGGQGIIACAASTSPGAAREADHWLVHVAVPFHGIRLAPVVWRRSSFWARSDQANYCETMGRVIALYALEALHRETGKLRQGHLLDLGPGMNRDPKYSEVGESLWKRMGDWFVLTLPAAVAWTVLLLTAFVAVLAIRGGLAHRRSARPTGTRIVR